jgi:hypothetical protein
MAAYTPVPNSAGNSKALRFMYATEGFLAYCGMKTLMAAMEKMLTGKRENRTVFFNPGALYFQNYEFKKLLRGGDAELIKAAVSLYEKFLKDEGTKFTRDDNPMKNLQLLVLYCSKDWVVNLIAEVGDGAEDVASFNLDELKTDYTKNFTRGSSKDEEEPPKKEKKSGKK